MFTSVLHRCTILSEALYKISLRKYQDPCQVEDDKFRDRKSFAPTQFEFKYHIWISSVQFWSQAKCEIFLLNLFKMSKYVARFEFSPHAVYDK